MYWKTYIGVVAVGLTFFNANIILADDDESTSLSTIESAESTWKIWGREIETSTNHFLPTQIHSQGEPLFSSTPSFVLNYDKKALLSQKPDATINNHKSDTLSSTKVRSLNELDIELSTNLQYDGFIQFKLTITPKNIINIKNLALIFPFKKNVARKFSKYIEYNYNTQRVDMTDLFDSSGPIQSDDSFSFNPAIWVGNEKVGLEWITETNLNWYLDEEDKAIELNLNDSSTELKLNLISKRDGQDFDSAITFEFALFATPSRPSSQEKYVMFNGNKNIPDNISCNAEPLNFFNWSLLPFQYPGLPIVDIHSDVEYKNIINETHKAGGKFIPYSSIYILPSTHPTIQKNTANWAAAPLRKNSSWASRLNTNKPILPVTLDSNSIRNFLLETHISHIQDHKTDGIYFDAAAPYENSAIAKHNRKTNYDGAPLQYVPMFSHREFVKTFWEQAKNTNPDFLILHHAPRVPKFATRFIDIVVVGEELNRLFKTQALNVKKIGVHPNSIPKLSFDKPQYYVPDYNELPKSISFGMRHHRDGVKYMLLPQVVKLNHDYLKSNPKLRQEWSESARAYATDNKLLLWNARLDGTYQDSSSCE